MTQRAFVVATMMLLACGSGEPQSNTAAANKSGSARHAAHVRITKCDPVGYGFECEAELDGEPATLEACVGSGDHIGLTPHIAPPMMLSVDVEPAADTDRYCGILIMPAGRHIRIVAVN
jgi:hypothetical protein